MGLVTHILMSFVVPRLLGTVLPGDTGVVVERGPDTVRGPDVAFYLATTLGFDDDAPGYAEVPPDLVVEIRSPNDSVPDMEERAQMWLGHGVSVVWVLFPETKSLDLYLSGTETASLGADSYVEGLEVLPDFRCRVGDMFGG